MKKLISLLLMVLMFSSISVFAVSVVQTNSINTEPNGICEEFISKDISNKGDKVSFSINGKTINVEYLGIRSEYNEYSKNNEDLEIYNINGKETHPWDHNTQFSNIIRAIVYGDNYYYENSDVANKLYIAPRNVGNFNEPKIAIYYSENEPGSESVDCADKKLKIQKGWNLLNFNYLLRDIGEENLFNRLYLFDSISKEYVLYSKNNENLIINLDNKMQEFYGSDEIALIFNSVWYYSDKEIIVPIFDNFKSNEELQEYINYYNKDFITSGWNLINVNEMMIGKSLYDLKGTCNIEKAYGWDTSTRNGGYWNNLLDENIPEEALGMGFALKVSSNCKLDFTGSSNIPAPPSIPNN